MSVMNGWRLQCANTSCLPFVNISVSNIRECQMACLAQVQCQVVSFQRTTFNCDLFAYIPNQTLNLTAHVDTVTMIVDLVTRVPRGQYGYRLFFD